MKNVQITNELFTKLIQYHILDIYETEGDIKKELERKLESLLRREVYTKSKTAPTEEERERSRQKYLDLVGMHPDFRW